MNKRPLYTMLLVFISFGFVLGGGVTLTAQTPDNCTLDLSAFTAAIDAANSAIDADEQTAALENLQAARAELDAILAACGVEINAPDETPLAEVNFDALTFTETTALRRTLPGGEVQMRYPESWQVTLGNERVIFTNDAAALDPGVPDPAHIVGVMTALLPRELAAFEITGDFNATDVVEVLSLGFAEAFDAANLDVADVIALGGVEAALLTGTLTEDDVTLNVAFAAVPVGPGYAFLSLSTVNEAVPVANLLERFLGTVSFATE